MTLKYVYGTILKAPERVIAHGVNCKGKAADGVAKAIMDRWPKAKVAYDYACVSSAVRAGLVNWAERGPDLWVANVFTQPQYGRDPEARYVSYDAIDKGLRLMIEEGHERGYLDPDGAVAIPLIGTGLGNGKWSVIKEIMAEVSTATATDLIIYEINKELYEKVSGETVASQAPLL